MSHQGGPGRVLNKQKKINVAMFIFSPTYYVLYIAHDYCDVNLSYYLCKKGFSAQISHYEDLMI